MSTILRVRTVLSYVQGGPGVQTAYFLPATVGGSVADATACVAGVRAFWDGIKASFLTSFTAQPQSEVAQIDNQTGNLVGTLSATPVSLVAGTVSGSYAPIASMALLRLRTGVVVNHRILRGRWFLGPLSTTAVDTNGRLGATNASAMSTAGNTLAAGVSGCFLQAWHRPSLLTGPGTSANVLTTSAASDLAVLRSRRDA